MCCSVCLKHNYKVVRWRFLCSARKWPSTVGDVAYWVVRITEDNVQSARPTKVGRKFDSQTKDIGTPENRVNKTSTSNTGTGNDCKTFQTISDLVQTRETDKKQARLLTIKIHDFSDIFTGISCSEGKFKVTGERRQHPYQVPPLRVPCALQKTLWEELDRLQKQQIVVHLDIGEPIWMV